MLAQINSVRGAFFMMALALLLAGCTPAGPRALLKGKKCLDHGDVSSAVTQLKRATTLLATNASAWNYYGVALQRANQPEEAAAAYERAITLDRDLLEAHFNLGLLYLEQNRPDLAKSEFTTYTLRRPNEAAGWLKLGFAQLRGGEALTAERSFSSVLALKTDEAEAYNALGLASVQIGKTRDAAEFFAAALQANPNFASALLNLATVNLQYLHDNRAALANYQAYLALTPRPANYNEVKAIVASLMQSDAAATIMAPAVIIKTSTPPPEPKPKPAPVVVSHPAPAPRAEPEETYVRRAPPRETVETSPAPAPTPAPAPVTHQVVPVHSAPAIAVAPRTNPPSHPTMMSPKPVATNAMAPAEPLEAPMPEEQNRPGFWHRLFAGEKGTGKRFRDDAASAPTTKPTTESAAAPAAPPVAPQITVPAAPAVTATNEEIAGTKPEEEQPAETKPAPVVAIPRYAYTSPAKPAAGERRSAEGAFTKARLAEQDQNWNDAEQWYQTAADADPSWFEAQYNTGVIAHRLRTFSVALPRYELALAIEPESVDARYNFALALKASGYMVDAAAELKKILAGNPAEVRAHLALANLCAQSLHDVEQAREHYLRVLSLQPNNPQAADIRFWLSANSK
jgi:tetratricopeptide (TPR) repeat protein